MEQKTTLVDWLAARAERNPDWVRDDLLREAESLEYLISEAIKKLRFPPEEGWSEYTDRGRRAAQALEALFGAIDRLLAGASPKEVELPEWLVSEPLQLPLPELVEAPVEAPPPTEEERPWEAFKISREMWERRLKHLLPEGNLATLVNNRIAVALHVPSNMVFAGPALKLLNEEDWQPGAIRLLGAAGINLLRQKLAEAGYPVPEPRPKGLPRARGPEEGLGGAG
jgi:hypothetical protein